VALNLLFTIDVDNDGVEHDERTALTWHSIAWIPDLKALFDSFNLCLTWFVRADNQLKEVYGTAAYLLLEHAQIWSQMESSGDEVAWHPHLYEWCEAKRQYVSDQDEFRSVEKLNNTYSELRTKGFDFLSVRIGEAFHSNATMHAVEQLGLKVDSTAIPGRKRHDESRVFDWEATPNEPYYPSRTDYRIPDLANHRNILEVPMTTVPIKADYDTDYLRRYLNPSFFHANFKEGLDRHLAARSPQKKVEEFMTIILHSDEVFATERTHSLYSFSLEEVRKNVAYLLNALEVAGLEYRILRMRDVLPNEDK
jgi:hypothetical protein